MNSVEQTCTASGMRAGSAGIFNPPGLAAIQYRIGDFTSFRRALLEAVVQPRPELSVVTTLSADLGGRATDTAVAVHAIAGFPATAPFVVRIGEEYLSVVAGAGSTSWKVARGARNSLPAKHTTGSSVVLVRLSPFEGWREGGHDDHLTMLLELWAYLGDILTFYQERIANEAFVGTATQTSSLLRLSELIDYRPSPGSGAAALVSFAIARGTEITLPARFRVGSPASGSQPAVIFETVSETILRGDHSAIPLAVLAETDQFGPSGGGRTVVLRGTNHRLAPSDFILAIENQGDSSEKASVHRLTSVRENPASDTTAIAWQEPEGTIYDRSARPVDVYALRVAASPFGGNAPAWNSLPPSLTGTINDIAGPFQDRNWDDPANPAFNLPPGGDVFLDGAFEAIRPAAGSPGWVVLVGRGHTSVFRVIDAQTVTRVDYAISGRATRLALGQQIAGSRDTSFPLRETLILTGADPLPLQNALPLPDPVSGASLALDGLYPGLAKGQNVVFQGLIWDEATQSATSITNAESRVLAAPPSLDTARKVTLVSLNAALDRRYAHAGSALLANIVEVTQGETVVDEILGSSDSRPFQSYTLRRNPLTWLPSTTRGGPPLQSTLNVTVNGVSWNERPSLLGSSPDAPDFMTALDETGRTSIVFGDGFSGAIPPTGNGNLRARYRKGLGASGNVAAGVIRQLIDNLPGIQSVTNPQPSSGGIDPERIEEIRVNAPLNAGTPGGAVTVEDHAAVALRFPGIAKAQARWVENAFPPYVHLVVATANQTPLSAQSTLAGRLRAFLDRRRDPTVPLRITDFSPVYLEVAVIVDIDDRFPRQATLNQVRAALNAGANPDGSLGVFAFERQGFGQPVHLSAVYATVQAVPGVANALITTLRRAGPGVADPALTVRDTLCIGPNEIAMMRNDPADPASGLLTISAGRGGFRDL